ncbi:MAG: hypothetical protein DME06_14305 [Candidatus Rokuibacteriota bacterium]|nr:MAG: hypothetical protein DME06_14305 [Candidatus Rokubacteria bacterium]
MTRPFGTSLRRDPGDPRGLRARIEAVLIERLEEAVDAACLEVLVEVRRARNLPPPVADDAEDRAEFDRLVRAFLGRLEAAVTVGLGAEERGRLAPAAPSTGAGPARLLADQAALATRLPDYWQRFETVKNEFAAEQTGFPPGRGGRSGRLLGRD